MSLWSEFKKGLWSENPIFRLVLGMCPTLAVTTSAVNGIGMGLATTFVLVSSNFIISMIRNLIPRRVRIPLFILVIATFVTCADLIMQAYFPKLSESLGIFIPLIVVNCIILGRAEAFASKHPVLESIADGLGMGVGFTLSLFVLGSIREILGNGTILGVSTFGSGYLPVIVMVLPPGAFVTLGVLLALMNRASRGRA
ncbi:MAG TPA: electron transport complex subunit E [Proteobacteria bacterium]|nr:electron transport complex subunit E [Pseudomonadota bacterium]